MQKFIPIFLIFVATLIAYLLGLQDYFNFETLQTHRIAIKAFAAAHPFITPIEFLAVYIFFTAISAPLDAFFCLTAGFLFPTFFAVLYLLIGGLCGGSLLFLAAKTAFAELFITKAGPRLKKLESAFQTNPFRYLVFLRLIPIFPTWMINVAPALFNVPYRTFLFASGIGIIPGAYVFSKAGAGLGALLDAPGSPNYRLLFNNEFFIGIALMCAIAVILLLLKSKLTK